jgi:hypothetical protein
MDEELDGCWSKLILEINSELLSGIVISSALTGAFLVFLRSSSENESSSLEGIHWLVRVEHRRNSASVPLRRQERPSKSSATAHCVPL